MQNVNSTFPGLMTTDPFGFLKYQQHAIQAAAAAAAADPDAPEPTALVIKPEQLMATLQAAAAFEPQGIEAEILALMQYKGQLQGALAAQGRHGPR